LASALLSGTQSAKFIADLSHYAPYDAVIAQDVLEHVEDPVRLAFDLATVACPGGLVIFANCFYPVIQCHLPSTFHLRHTFPYVMQFMGLEYLGRVPGAEHALAFRKRTQIVMKVARMAERLSKVFGPLLNKAHPLAVKLFRPMIANENPAR
jgi:2-polyprenyl-6-hydroxyphenyl methylase/3-demethylubiquinone-9 3-methyltransferase